MKTSETKSYANKSETRRIMTLTDGAIFEAGVPSFKAFGLCSVSDVFSSKAFNSLRFYFTLQSVRVEQPLVTIVDCTPRW